MSYPNILYIHSHDTGRYIQPFGHAMPTPNFQRLAEQGVLFRQAFCANPTCSPSRAALLTGQWPHSCGMLGLAHRGFRLNDYSHHLVHTLKKAGYTTALSGFQHVGRPPAADPSEIGYDEIFDTAKNQQTTTDAAIAFLNRSHDKPFFLDVGYTVTHRSFPEPGPGDDPRYCIPSRAFARHPRNPIRYRRLQNLRSHSRYRSRARPQRHRSCRTFRQHHRHQHHRPRHCIPHDEMQPHRSRHRRFAHHARTGFFRRQSHRWHGLSN